MLDPTQFKASPDLFWAAVEVIAYQSVSDGLGVKAAQAHAQVFEAFKARGLVQAEPELARLGETVQSPDEAYRLRADLFDLYDAACADAEEALGLPRREDGASRHLIAAARLSRAESKLIDVGMAQVNSDWEMGDACRLSTQRRKAAVDLLLSLVAVDTALRREARAFVREALQYVMAG